MGLFDAIGDALWGPPVAAGDDSAYEGRPPVLPWDDEEFDDEE